MRFKVFIAVFSCILSVQTFAQKVTPFNDPNTRLYGFKAADGTIIIQPKYSSATDFGTYDANLSRVESNGRTGLVNSSGKEIAETKYFGIEKFHDGLAVARMGNTYYGYLDTAGKEVIPLIYNNARDFANGIAVVTLYDKKDNPKRGLIDRTGKVVAALKYDELYGFSDDGLCQFNLGSKKGFIDRNGIEVLSFSKYERLGYFIFNRAVVSKGDKWGYIDRKGKEIIPMKYDMAENFDEEGHGKVKSKEQYFLIDTLGNPAKGNVGFNITAKVNVAIDHWVVVTKKDLKASEPVYFLTAEKYGKLPMPFGASITWQIIDNQDNVVKEQRTPAGGSCGFKVPRDGLYTIQAYYDIKDCVGCTDKPNAFTMQYSFNTQL